MRKINTKDVFQLARIFKKINLKDLMVSKASAINDILEDKTMTTTQVGMNIVFTIIENCPDAENEIYKFIANISGFAVEEIENMELEMFIEIIGEIIKENDLKKVFTLALNLMKK